MPSNIFSKNLYSHFSIYFLYHVHTKKIRSFVAKRDLLLSPSRDIPKKLDIFKKIESDTFYLASEEDFTCGAKEGRKRKLIISSCRGRKHLI